MTMTVRLRCHGVVFAVPGRRGDRGIEAVVMAALAQWARIPTRGARGSDIAALDREGGRRRRMPVHDGAMGDREGGEGVMVTGGVGIAGGGGG